MHLMPLNCTLGNNQNGNFVMYILPKLKKNQLGPKLRAAVAHVSPLRTPPPHLPFPAPIW